MTTTTTRKQRSQNTIASPATVNVAIYCRVSTDERLGQEFNSLHAQREACEAYVASQRGTGWAALPEPYNDGGYTGANTDRPGFQRLLADVRAGNVNAIAVYKLDRLSRSIRDFVNVLEVFEQHGVTFVSVTQPINTAGSMGRLLLNILMSFAEFERQVNSERTRDKIAATRRKGLWCGGRPLLGYDVVDKKLILNPDEAERVRLIFRMYLECGSLLSTCDDLEKLGWRGKPGKSDVLGHAFDKTLLHRLLTNPVYHGLVRYKDEVHPGQHQAIVDETTWDAVQAQLRSQSRERPTRTRNKSGVLLAGLVRCAICDSGMVHHYASRPGGRRYSYLVCNTQQKRGAQSCPGSRVSVRDLDAFVIERIREMGRDPTLVAETVKAARQHLENQWPEIEAELRRLDQERRHAETERGNLVNAAAQGGAGVPALLVRLGQVEDVLHKASQRLEEQRQRLAALAATTIDEGELTIALAAFDDVWNQLVPRERARVLRLLIETVTFNGQTGNVELRLRPTGIKTLATESGRKSA